MAVAPCIGRGTGALDHGAVAHGAGAAVLARVVAVLVAAGIAHGDVILLLVAGPPTKSFGAHAPERVGPVVDAGTAVRAGVVPGTVVRVRLAERAPSGGGRISCISCDALY